MMYRENLVESQETRVGQGRSVRKDKREEPDTSGTISDSARNSCIHQQRTHQQ